MSVGHEDAQFLRWVADWLDRIDPILRAVFTNPKLKNVTDEERRRMDEWLEGTEVQERLRDIAAAEEREEGRP